MSETDPIQLDSLRCQAHVMGQSIDLTATESAFLAYLLDNDGQLVSKSELLINVWGYHANVRSRTVDTTLARLRAKIEPDPKHPTYLVTVRGKGVRLVDGMSLDSSNETMAPFFGREQEKLSLGRHASGLAIIVGAPGCGKSRLAKEVFSEALWVPLRDQQTPAHVLGALEGVLGCGNLTVDSVAEKLALLDATLVLDSCETLDPDAIALLPLLAASSSVVITSERLLCSGDTVIRLGPLPPEPAFALLKHHVNALGLPVSDDVLQQVVDGLDRMPLELELVAPTLGLLGLSGLSLVPDDDSMGNAIERSLGLLAPGAREVISQLSVFVGEFDLAAAAMVAHRSPKQLLPLLTGLVQRSLVEVNQGRFHLLSAIRRRAIAHPDDSLTKAAADGLRQFVLSLSDQALIDGSTTLSRHRPDLLTVSRGPLTAEQATILAMIYVDLGGLVGEVSLLPEVFALASRFGDCVQVQLAALLLRTGDAPVLTDKEHELVSRAPENSILAAILITRDAQARSLGIVEKQRTEFEQLILTAPIRSQARYLPLALSRGRDPSLFNSKTRLLKLHATTHGWRTALDNLLRAELSILVRCFHYGQALDRVEQWPAADNIMGSETAFWMGVCAMMTNDLDRAYEEFGLQGKRHFTDILLSYGYQGVAAAALGRVEEAKSLFIAALKPGLPRGIRDLLSAICWAQQWPGYQPPTDSRLVDLTQGPLGEQPRVVNLRLFWQLRKLGCFPAYPA